MMPERLLSFYHTNFTLSYSSKFSLKEIEDMLPWEKVLYMSLLETQLQKEEEEMKKMRESMGK